MHRVCARGLALWLAAISALLSLSLPAQPTQDSPKPDRGSTETALIAIGLTDVERKWLREQRTITVFTKTDWAPIDLYTLEGQYRGLSGEYLRLIAHRLHVEFTYVPQPSLAEALAALREGRAQILPSVARTVDRDQYMVFTDSYLEVPNVYITRKGFGEVSDRVSLAGVKIAVERGFAVRELLRERHPHAELVEVNDSAKALKAVSEGAADVYVGALPTSSFLAERLLLTNLEVRTPSRSTLSSLHFGLLKDNQVLRSIMNKALASITLAERQAIHAHWVPLRSSLIELSPPIELNDDERRFVRQLPPLRVGFDVDHYPYTFAKAGDAGVGMAFDTFRLLQDKLGLVAGTAVGGDWPQTLQRFRNREVDILIAIARNAEREKEFEFIGPWVSTPTMLLVSRSHPAVTSMAGFAGKKVAVLKDGQTAFLLAQRYPQVVQVPVANRDELLSAVATGRADASLVNSTFAVPRLEQGVGAVLKIAGIYPELNSDLYLAVHADQRQLARLLQRAYVTLTQDERAAIASRWATLPVSVEGDQEVRQLFNRTVPLLFVLGVVVLIAVMWLGLMAREIQRRRAAELALAAARDRAERLALARADFIAVASHEVRTPVNAIVGALAQLQTHQLQGSARELASHAAQSARTLSEFVNNLLDLSKSDAGQLSLAPRADDFAAVVRETVTSFGPQASAKGLSLVCEIAPELPARLVFDVLRTRQILMNLVSNAIKFTDLGTVTVAVAAEAHSPSDWSITLTVSDTGCGMTEAQRARLFVAYQQADAAVAEKYGGTGLGLTLVDRLVRAMNGRVTVQSNPGAGTSIQVRLTLPSASADRAASIANSQATVAPCRVLVADDTRLQQMLIANELTALGCTVDCASDGVEALALWRQHHHRLVITDQRMPSMDGPELTRTIRDSDEPQPLIIMATADADDTARGIAAGADAVVQKPLSRAVLADCLARCQTSSPTRAQATLTNP